MTPPIWKWAPNWATPVLERLHWKTAIQTARGGVEKRQRLAAIPRTHISFEAEVHESKYQELSMQIQSHQVDEWLMPIWWDPSEIVVVSPTSLVFDASNRDFSRSPGWAWAVLVHPQSGVFKAVEIAKMQGPVSAWSLRDAIVPADWPVGTRIYPARKVLLSTAQELLQVTAGVVRLGVECRVLDNINHVKSVTPINLELREPNRIRPLSAGLESLVGDLDFNVGVFSQVDYVGRPTRTATHDYVLFNREELGEMRADLAFLAGRLGELRVATFQADFDGFSASPIFTQDGEFYARPTTLVDAWTQVDGFMLKHLKEPEVKQFATFNDVYLSALNGWAWAESNIAGPDTLLRPQDCKLSFVYRSRLATDTVEIRHITPEVSQISLSFRSLI